MEDPDWMTDFKPPTDNVSMLSSSSPSSSSRDDSEKNDGSQDVGKDLSETNGKDGSDDEDSPLISALVSSKGTKSFGRKVRNNDNKKGECSTTKQTKDSPAKKEKFITNKTEEASLDLNDDDDEDDTEQKPKVFVSRRSRGLKRVLKSDNEDEEDWKPAAKVRKTSASPAAKRGVGKSPGSGRKGKRVSFSNEDEPLTFKRTKRAIELVDTPASEEDEESLPLTSLVRKRKDSESDAEEYGDKVIATSSAMKKEPPGASALISLKGFEKAADEEEAPSAKAEAVQDEEPGEVSEGKIKPRASSSLPVVFADKVHRTKVLLECEGDALDLSGDMGAVGRFSVSSGREKGEDDLRLDLKGIIYKTTIVPSNTFFVVNVGQNEAKVETIMNDFMQLRQDVNQVEDETVVEGTLEGFAFDFDNEGDPLSTPVPTTGPAGSDEDEDAQKKKTPSKTQKVKKSTAGKSAKSRGKGAAKKPRAKGKPAGKKASKSKPAINKRVKSKRA